MRDMRIIVEPIQNTFSGYHIYIKFETIPGRYRAVSFTTWKAAFDFFLINNINNFRIVVHSEIL